MPEAPRWRWRRGEAEPLQQLPHPPRPRHGLGLLEDLDLRQGDAPDDQSPLPDLLVQLLHDLVGAGRLFPGQLTNLRRNITRHVSRLQHRTSYMFLGQQSDEDSFAQ